MIKLMVLVAFVLVAGVCFNANSNNLDEAICLKDNKEFTCKASYEDKDSTKACIKAREIAGEGCFKENIQCNIVDNISLLKNGNYLCNAVAVGNVL